MLDPLEIPRRDDPWKMSLSSLAFLKVPLSWRAYRVLQLQMIDTVEAMAGAVYQGTIAAYPGWLQEEVRGVLESVSPRLDTYNEEIRAHQQSRKQRMATLSWDATVIGRHLSDDESARLSRIDLRAPRLQLHCQDTPEVSGRA